MINRCDWVSSELEIKYHDNEWGIAIFDDKKLFEFLILETMQAGLSWSTILKKRENMRLLFSNFNPYKISQYDSKYIEKLMSDDRIIRNRLKLNSMVVNANKFIEIVNEYETFSKYIWSFVDYKPITNKYNSFKDVPSTNLISDKMSKDLKKRGFKFVGSKICYAFMQATGMVNDHIVTCYKHNNP